MGRCCCLSVTSHHVASAKLLVCTFLREWEVFIFKGSENSLDLRLPRVSTAPWGFPDHAWGPCLFPPLLVPLAPHPPTTAPAQISNFIPSGLTLAVVLRCLWITPLHSFEITNSNFLTQKFFNSPGILTHCFPCHQAWIPFLRSL